MGSFTIDMSDCDCCDVENPDCTECQLTLPSIITLTATNVLETVEVTMELSGTFYISGNLILQTLTGNSVTFDNLFAQCSITNWILNSTSDTNCDFGITSHAGWTCDPFFVEFTLPATECENTLGTQYSIPETTFTLTL